MRTAFTLSILLASGTVAFNARPAHAQESDCRVGTYRLTDGTDVNIGASDGEHLRWRHKDGTSGKLTRAAGNWWTSTLGWSDRPDGKRVEFDCSRNSIAFVGTPGERIALDE